MAYDYITSSGTVLADTSAIKAEVESEFRIVLGLDSDAAIDSSTTEGRLVDMITNERVSIARNNALLANQINPNLAYSTFFDAVYALLGGQRDAAEQSTCDCLLSGVSGTIIPAGSIAQDTSGELWNLVSETTIPVSGSITASFRSENYGEISAEIGEINTIVSGVLGWETITNEVAATLGKTEQSLISAKIQRRVEIGANSRSASYSTIAAVNKLDGVIGVQFRVNYESISQVIDNITIPAKSTWLCVDGGATSEIAAQYVINTWGTAFHGFSNTIFESYTDPDSGQIYNNTIAIDRPTDLPIKIEITAKILSTTDLISSIKNAVQKWADGNIEGYSGCSLGNIISPFEISAALNDYFGSSSVYIQKIRITTVADNAFSFDEISTELWEKCSVTEANTLVISV